ncbi:MAG: DUF4166 domain-containing protein [Gammaproteobacteria bacterium]|nr:DUF4166 domain-containing protein [Gammaproteobacteria bacterium]
MSQKEQLPVIQRALGENWSSLSMLVRQHYDITPGTASSLVIKGVMDEVHHSAAAKLFLLPGRVFGALVPYRGKQVPTEVRNWTSTGNSEAMFWHRTLEFSNRPPTTDNLSLPHGVCSS